MADVWKASVTFGSISYTGPTAAVLPDGVDFSGYTFNAIAYDSDGGHGEFPAIQMTLEGDGSGNIQTVERHGYLVAGSGLAATATFTTAGDASFLAGGTFAITKDDGANTFAFQSPFNSSSTPWDAFAVAGTMGVDQLSLFDQATTNDSGATYHATTLQIQAHDLWADQNGTHIQGATLAAGDRGHWVPQSDPLDPWFFGRFGNVTVTDTDDAATEGAKIDAGVPIGGGGAGAANGSRQWDGTFLSGAGAGAAVVGSTTIPEHGPMLAVYVPAAAPTDLRGRDSYDRGASWSDGLIYTNPTAMNSSPNIFWSGRALSVVWYNGTSILLSISWDLATTWSAPVTLAITGKNPKVLLDRFHGLQYFFYLDASNNVLLARSGDYGQTFIDAAPRLVAATITPQTVAAEIASDGSLLVGWIASGAWQQMRSADLGLSWS